VNEVWMNECMVSTPCPYVKRHPFLAFYTNKVLVCSLFQHPGVWSIEREVAVDECLRRGIEAYLL